MRVEWVGRSRQDGDNQQADPARLINIYREKAGDKPILKRVPGMVPFVDLASAPLRAMEQEAGKVFAVSGADLSCIDGNGTVSELGQVSADGDVSISGNNGSAVVSSGGKYYVWDGETLKQPGTGAFSEVGSVEFLGQRTLTTELNGRRFGWSDVADPEAIDGLSFATAESTDDNIIRGAVIQGIYWIFKEQSIERWYQTGGENFLAPMSGGDMETGLLKFGLFIKFPNGAFFVGNDGIAYLVSGGSMRPVSTRGVETALEQKDATHCLYYQDEGHKFCVIRFADREAWVYDLTMDEWHERAEGGSLTPWSATHSVQAFGADFVGSAFGRVFSLDRVPSDDGQPLIGKAVSRTIRNNGNRFRVSRLTLIGAVGNSTLTAQRSPGLHIGGGYMLATDGYTALATGDDVTVSTDSKVSLRASKDRGKTWSLDKTRSLGRAGEHDKVVRWRSLGQFRNANFEITISDDTDITLEAIGEIELA
ncbi:MULTISPECIES: hypothetical protein [unclassified Phaeobacter]|uniref:hypothetical protein n=2 Tax=unclassified Phaeobacter TaxID=2621772 RepID=UPI003A8A86D0